MKARGESGFVLLIVLWILVMLTMMALGIGRQVRVDLALARYAVGAVRARAVAWSGVQYAAARIAQDSADPQTASFDTFGQCGFRLENGETADDVFHAAAVPGGTVDIVPSWGASSGPPRFGLADEEGRLNLNALTPANYQILRFLLEGHGISEDTAETIASSVVDWVDADREVFNAPFGQEDGRPAAKNLPLDHPQEMRLIKGMTPEIYAAVAGEITVFPRTGRLLINMNTAAPAVLQAWARQYAGARTNTSSADAESLAEKILSWRRGGDGADGTADDRVIEAADLHLNQKEQAIFMLMENDRTRVSQFLRMGVRGTDDHSGVVYRMDAVISRAGMRIIDSRVVRQD